MKVIKSKNKKNKRDLLGEMKCRNCGHAEVCLRTGRSRKKQKVVNKEGGRGLSAIVPLSAYSTPAARFFVYT
jgi:hypothetical protein